MNLFALLSRDAKIRAFFSGRMRAFVRGLSTYTLTAKKMQRANSVGPTVA